MARLSCNRTIECHFALWRRAENRMGKGHSATVQKQPREVGPPQVGITEGLPQSSRVASKKMFFPSKPACRIGRGDLPPVNHRRRARCVPPERREQPGAYLCVSEYDHGARRRPWAPFGSARWRCEFRQREAARSRGYPAPPEVVRRPASPVSKVMGPWSWGNEIARACR